MLEKLTRAPDFPMWPLDQQSIEMRSKSLLSITSCLACAKDAGHNGQRFEVRVVESFGKHKLVVDKEGVARLVRRDQSRSSISGGSSHVYARTKIYNLSPEIFDNLGELAKKYWEIISEE